MKLWRPLVGVGAFNVSIRRTAAKKSGFVSAVVHKYWVMCGKWRAHRDYVAPESLKMLWMKL